MRGEKPAHLAIQQSTKFGLFINLKLPGRLGSAYLRHILARAEEVID